ncbi:MAG: choice-of-anchor D domain-containing protein [Terriglobales bacterium]
MRTFPLVVVATLLSSLFFLPASASAQQLQCNPCSYNFGDVKVGTTVSYSLTLSNAGTRVLEITSKSKQGDAFSFNDFVLPVKIRPGASIALPVTFAPTAPGNTDGTLSLVTNDPKAPLSKMSFSGTGVSKAKPELTVSPATLNFGDVKVGSSATLQATLTASNSTVTITSDQSSNSQFAIVGLKLPIMVPAGDSISVTVQFTPSASGTANGTANFTSNAANSPTAVQLTGIGVAKAVAQLAISPASINFGNVKVGSSATLQATLSASNAAVTISADQSSSSQFAIVGLHLPVTIAAGKSIPVTLEFIASTAGTATGTVSFTSNAENSPTTAQLTGKGIANGNGQLQLSPASLNFGSVTLGSKATLQVSLAASVVAVTISADQSNSSEFAVLGLNLPVTIPAGNTIPVTIQFTPNASGTASGKVGFISNAANSPTIEQLTGTGVAQQSHSVSLSWNAGDNNAAGYNVYRGTASSGPFYEINSSLDPSTSYTDSTVDSGATYYYATTEVNAQGEESAYSNVAEAVIPNP